MLKRIRGLAPICAAALCLAACGGDAETGRSREPAPAPRVELSAADQERWTPAPASRTGVPVLLYRGVTPDAFAPPGGNYGQAGTNDPRIPRLLLARLELSFDLVFTQDRPGFATPGAPNPLGRIEITPAVSDEQLRERLG